MAETVYAFSATKALGGTQPLRDYEGRVLLIVNTASQCGFTPQFEGLQQLFDEFKGEGLTVLGFPCDQFMNQEFGDIQETLDFCQVNYGVTFPMFAKVDVKGPDADPLFQFLTAQKKGILGGAIKWNFTKFLIGRDGCPVERYAPQTKPEKIREDIIKLIRE
ncbi:glutathione peroxidase [Edaphobacillus lindanitolerans]|uniref:Glutathione peroxidase n=1 Tax=Edaphobacillus lindanitolerans TaxID=550447 RepID=A0A1U7PP17_9BACI|nr:glutathione peroxidase [Edaphobacillus lindanitolerans]SIT93487.1 glutathione peroxidase [Edaphobacillus lindanitolerans]